MAKRVSLDKCSQNWMTYTEYFKLLEYRCSCHIEGTDAKGDYYRINLQRSRRISRTYTVSETLKHLVESLAAAQIWIVITEPWCGDSAQTVPYIAKISECSPQIKFRILLRDDNPDIMDRYLTNGSRSIPKLIAFTPGGKELFQWGPRPAGVAEIFQAMTAVEDSRETIHETIHTWYAGDNGRTFEKELVDLLKTLQSS